jgi:glutaredoxin 3
MGEPMSDSDVVVYSTGWCPYCERVDEDPAERDAMLARSGGRRTVPQIFIGDHHVGGYDDLYALDKAGELDKLLGRA